MLCLNFSETTACGVNGAVVTISSLDGAAEVVGTSEIGSAGPGVPEVGDPIEITADGCGSIIMTVDLTFDWNPGSNSGWLHGVSYFSSSGWVGATGSSPGGDWIPDDNGMTGACSGNTYGEGFYYEGSNNSSINPATGVCEIVPGGGGFPEQDPTDPSDNWGTPTSGGSNFGFELEYCGSVGANVAESITFQLTDDGETGAWANPFGCIFTLTFPIIINEPELALEDEYEICAGECIDLETGVDCPDSEWSNGESGATITVCPATTTDFTVEVGGDCYDDVFGMTTVTVNFCCDADAGDLSSNPIEFCPGEEITVSVADYQADSEYTQQIFIADINGDILSWNVGDEITFQTPLFCQEFVLGSFNYNTATGPNILTIEDVSSFTEIPAEMGICWEMETYEFETLDEDAPVFESVSDVTVNCINDVPDDDEELEYNDNCLEPGSVEGTDTEMVVACDTSVIVRTWMVTDHCGNSATASKTYTIVPPDFTPCDDGNPCTTNDRQKIDCQGNVCVPCAGDPGAADSISVVVPPNLCVGSQVQLNVKGCTPSTAIWYSDSLLVNQIAQGENLNYNVTQDSVSIWVSCMGGCSQITEQIVIEAQALTQPNIQGSLTTLCDPSDVSTLSLGSAYTSYIWSDNTTNSTLSVTSGRTYSVTVADAAGCSAIASIDIMDESIPAFQIGGSDAFCAGSSTMLSGPTGMSSYAWSPGNQTTETISVSDAGTYTLTVSNASGCSATAQLAVTVGTQLSVDLPVDTTYCFGTQLTLSANPGMSSYAWSNNETTPSIVSTTGIYTVTITDSSGCSGEHTVNVAEGPELQIDIQGANSFCSGSATTLSASVPGLTYQWSTGESTESISVGTAGMIDLLVTDGNGCTAQNSIMVTEEDIAAISISGPSSICSGSSADLMGPAGFADYEWGPNGEATETISISAAGTYSLTVTNSDGCTAESSTTITEESSISFDLEDQGICAGLDAILEGPAGYEYLWGPNGEITQTITVNQAGTYTLTITDGSGCSGENSAEVTLEDALTFFIQGATTLCNGSSSQLSGPAGFANYEWAPGGETTEAIEVNTPGTYTLIVTDINGCTGEDMIDVIEDDKIDFDIEGMPSFCEGETTMINGPAGYDSYLWGPDGQTDPEIEVGAAGTYTLTITDASGCTGESTLEVVDGTIPGSVLVDVSSDFVLDCNVSSLEIGNAAETGLSYEWLDDQGDKVGDTSPLNITEPGMYTYVVTDDLTGCSEMQQIEVTQIGDVPIATIVADPDNIINCQVQFVTLTAPGEDNVDYTWQYGSQTIQGSTVDVSEETEVTLIAVDTLTGCSSQGNLMVEDLTNFPLIAFEQPLTLTCNNPSIDIMMNDVNTSSGASFSHQWYDPDGNPIAGQGDMLPQVTVPGWYSYELVDALTTCENIDSIFVDADFAEPVISTDATAEIACDESTIVLNLTTQDNYTLNWTTTTGSIIIGADSENPEVDAAGLYFITATGDNGCTSLDSVLVDEVIAIEQVIVTADMLCNQSDQGSLMVVDVMGGTGPYTFELDGQTNDSGEFGGLNAGDFELVVLDQNGCRWSEMVAIEQFDPIQFSVTEDQFDLVAPQDVSVELNTNLTDFDLVWSPVPAQASCLDCLDPVLNVLTSETYTVTIFDANGCSTEVMIDIRIEQEYVPERIFVPNAFSPDGDGVNDEFLIFNNDQVTLDRFVIYDRWGNEVFLQEEFDPNGSTLSWDGRHKGEEVITGVYVYLLEYRDQDGNNRQLAGSITMF